MAKQPVILQLVPELNSGGVERGTIDIARAIAKEGWRSIVASAGGSLLPHVSHAGAEHIKLPLATKNPLGMWMNSGKLRKIIKEQGVDIVHARSRAPAWSGYFATKKTNVHFMTSFHGVYGLQNSFKHFYNGVMAKGERVIAVSEFISDHIISNYHMDERNIRIIHRGVDLNYFSPGAVHKPRLEELIKQWGLPNHSLPVILFPGRVTRWKGQDVFIKSLAQLSHRNFIAIIVGDDSKHETYRKELETLVHDLKLEGHVRMVGSTQYMAEAYTLANLVVATSVEPEAFGRVVLEAQAMGKPVIATNHGGARETVQQGVTGWLVEPGGVDALAKTIDNALRQEASTLEFMGTRGQENARQFSLEQMCSKTIAVYKELLGS